jgi:hypothetical protein
MTSSPSSSTSLPFKIALAVVTLAAAVLLWIVFAGSDDGDDKQTATAPDGPTIVDEADLSAEADRVGHPIYWVGEREGKQYELSESSSGRVYVRYLDEDTEPGVRSAQFLTVATYPLKNPVAGLRIAAKQSKGAVLARSRDDAFLLIDPNTPGSIRLAYPGSDQQIEVYSPNSREAIKLATDGDVQPVP